MKQFLNPDSYAPNGRSRLISIDVLRGLSMLFLPLIHDVVAFVDYEYLLNNMTKVQLPFVLPIALAAVLFGHWRGLFVLLSGVTFGYLNAFLGSGKGKIMKETVVRTLGALVLVPVFYVFDIVEQILCKVAWATKGNYTSTSKTYKDFVNTPWLSQAAHQTPTPTFFALTFVILPWLNAFIVLITPERHGARSAPHRCLFARAGVWTALSCAFHWATDAVHFGLYKMLLKGHPEVRGHVECPFHHVSGYGASLGAYVRNQLGGFVSGPHTYVFPFFGSLALGCAFGSFLRGSRELLAA